MSTVHEASPSAGRSAIGKLGLAWIILSFSIALHVVDEALTGFLDIYNPTVLALRAKLGFWPMPTFGFRQWFIGLSLGVVLLLALSPFVFRGSRWVRPLFYVLCVIMIGNALGHTMGTIFGQTVSSVRFARPAPGFYSSPLLLAASIYALLQLRKTRTTWAVVTICAGPVYLWARVRRPLQHDIDRILPGVGRTHR